MLHEAKVAKSLAQASSTSLTYYKAHMDSSTLLKMLMGGCGQITNEKVGRLERGYLADIVVLSARNIKNMPVHSPVEAAVNRLEEDSVTDVLVGGRLVVEDGVVKTIDEEEVVNELLDREEVK
ncbi:MAG: amidohydrolase family protein [Desulfurococcaceae archaeon]